MSTQLPDSGRERGTHPAQVGHLVMGLAFLGLVGIWAAVQYHAVDTGNVQWLLPLPWVFAGAAGLVAAVVSGRRSTRPVPVPHVAPAYAEVPADEVPEGEVPEDATPGQTPSEDATPGDPR